MRSFELLGRKPLGATTPNETTFVELGGGGEGPPGESPPPPPPQAASARVTIVARNERVGKEEPIYRDRASDPS
jgi:hypothetical protein